MVELILEAAAQVLERESLERYTTNRVAEVAGISIGSLYQYFPGKDAITAALIRRAQSELAESIEKVVSAAQGRPLRWGVEALVDTGLRLQFERAGLAAALDYEERRLPVNPVVQEAAGRIRAALASWLAGHGVGGQPRDHDRAAHDLFVIVRALVDEAGREQWSRTETRRRVCRAVLGYLANSPQDPTGG